MHFLPDVCVTCDTCKGARYNRETLEIKFRGKSIADVLDDDGRGSGAGSSARARIGDRLRPCRRSGSAISARPAGADALRRRGAAHQAVQELARRATGRTLYILDEPTTGFHFEDVRKLLEVLHALADLGNTVVVIEHNLEVIKTADWVLDLGPEGGEGGGTIVAEGPPEVIAANPASHTGRFLRPLLPRAELRQAG